MQIPHARIWLTLTAVLLATTATAPSAVARSKSIPAASAFSLPSAQRCAGSTLKLKLRKLRHVKWLGATIKIDGRRVKTLKRSQVTKPVTLRHLPRVRFVLSISAKANRHRSAKATRTYTRCAPKPAPPAPKPPVTPPPGPPAGRPLPAATPAARPRAGRSGSTSPPTASTCSTWRSRSSSSAAPWQRPVRPARDRRGRGRRRPDASARPRPRTACSPAHPRTSPTRSPAT